MENYSKTKPEQFQKSDILQEEVHPIFNSQTLKSVQPTAETENELNSKILAITMKIKDQYPELSKYLEEMQETIPDEKNPEITRKNLKTYYDSLNTMLNKYVSEH